MAGSFIPAIYSANISWTEYYFVFLLHFIWDSLLCLHIGILFTFIDQRSVVQIDSTICSNLKKYECKLNATIVFVMQNDVIRCHVKQFQVYQVTTPSYLNDIEVSTSKSLFCCAHKIILSHHDLISDWPTEVAHRLAAAPPVLNFGDPGN